MTRATVPRGLEGLAVYLAALAGSASGGHLLELRYRRPGGGMGQRFFDSARPDAAAAAIAVLGQQRDVFVGAALRARRQGTRDAVAAGWALWADCDDESAAAALAGFEPASAIVVRSGTGENRHGYWPLDTPLEPAALEHANRRLAQALGADQASTDAARVLRAPGSLNHKHDPPAPVALESVTGERFDTTWLLAALPDVQRRVPGPPTPPLAALDDPLRAIEPAVYVAALTGRQPGRDRKVTCPLHNDRTPSLHVYEAPEDGWWCFGCRRGGSVYDLASPLLGLPTRGPGFLQLRRRLYELLLEDPQPATGEHTRDRHLTLVR